MPIQLGHAARCPLVIADHRTLLPKKVTKSATIPTSATVKRLFFDYLKLL
jgi:hypothetical protein